MHMHTGHGVKHPFLPNTQFKQQENCAELKAFTENTRNKVYLGDQPSETKIGI